MSILRDDGFFAKPKGIEKLQRLQAVAKTVYRSCREGTQSAHEQSSVRQALFWISATPVQTAHFKEMRAWLNYNELPRTKELSSLWHGTFRKLSLSISVFVRRWSEMIKNGFGLILKLDSFTQYGLGCDWKMERGVWYLKCSMVMSLLLSLHSPRPLPTQVYTIFSLLPAWFDLQITMSVIDRPWREMRNAPNLKP